MGEINTRGAVRSKVSGFPAGNDNECLSKTEITATNTAVVNGSYGNTECPMREDITENVIEIKDHVLLVDNITIPKGNSDFHRANVVSYANKYINGVFDSQMQAPCIFENSSDILQSVNGGFTVEINRGSGIVYNHVEVRVNDWNSEVSYDDYVSIVIIQVSALPIMKRAEIKVFYR